MKIEITRKKDITTNAAIPLYSNKNDNHNDVEIEEKKINDNNKITKRKRNNNTKSNLTENNEKGELLEKYYEVIYEALKIITKKTSINKNANNNNTNNDKQERNKKRRIKLCAILNNNNNHCDSDCNNTIQSLIMSKDPTIVAECIHKDRKKYRRTNKKNIVTITTKNQEEEIHYFVKRYFLDECTAHKTNPVTTRWIKKILKHVNNTNQENNKNRKINKRMPSRYNQFIKVFITKSKKENPNTPIKIIFRNAANKWTQHYKLLH